MSNSLYYSHGGAESDGKMDDGRHMRIALQTKQEQTGEVVRPGRNRRRYTRDRQFSISPTYKQPRARRRFPCHATMSRPSVPTHPLPGPVLWKKWRTNPRIPMCLDERRAGLVSARRLAPGCDTSGSQQKKKKTTTTRRRRSRVQISRCPTYRFILGLAVTMQPRRGEEGTAVVYVSAAVDDGSRRRRRSHSLSAASGSVHTQ
ncbi:hypothetical protein LZ31DRAFT_242900 [Colletotrichum somersetense]|nr:hypothetical protein LZ31DRAFT_242900 [Colletotrichum somersetense]